MVLINCLATALFLNDRLISESLKICWGNRSFIFVTVLWKAKKMQIASVQAQLFEIQDANFKRGKIIKDP